MQERFSKQASTHRTGMLCLTLIIIITLTCVAYWVHHRQEMPSITNVAEGADQPHPKRIRPAALAGTWYPTDPKRLKRALQDYLKTASANVKTRIGRIPALICPHAAYTYSGITAAYGYRLIQGRDIRRVILIGPSHHGYFRGISSPNATHYQTPLGLVPLDRPVIRELLKKEKLFQNHPQAHKQEHCLEIQLPFLQCVLKKFRIVPLLVGQVSGTDISKIAQAVRPYLDANTLLIVSSDFTHYGPRFRYVPFTHDVPAALRRLDMGAVTEILQRDSVGLMNYCQRIGATICGRNAIAVLLSLMQNSPATPELLRYTTSGAMTDDYTNSVSYAALCFTQKPPQIVKPDEQTRLMKLARQTITQMLKDKTMPNVDTQTLTPTLTTPRACFVTLKKNGRLRGCIGSLTPSQPLYKDVMQRARHAAFSDYRFKPVQKEELDALHIEISVLSVPRTIQNVEEFKPGEHGIIIQKGIRRAVYLPQVAPEQGWDRETTLTHLCRKAGLSRYAWKSGMIFRIFTVQAIEEHDSQPTKKKHATPR